MPSWWRRSSSKDPKKKKNKENSIEAPHLLGPSGDIGSIKPVLPRRYHTDFIAVKGSRSRVASRSLSPSSKFIQWQSFSDTQAQPLPTPETQSCGITRVSSETNMTTLEKRGKAPLSLPIPKRDDISTRSTPLDTSGGLATASESSDYSIGSDVHADPNVYNPTSISYRSPLKDVANPLSLVHKNHPSHMPGNFLEESPEPFNCEDNNQFLSRSPRGLVSTKRSCILNSKPGGPCLNECPVDNQYRRSSMPNSSQISAQSSKETEHLFWPQNGCSPEYSRLSSPKKLSPGPISRKQNEVVTLLHPWGGGTAPVSPVGRAHSMKKRSMTDYYSTPSSRQISPGRSPRVQSGSVTPRVAGMAPESPTCPADEVKKQCHRLPLPPLTSSCTTFSPLNSTSNNSPAIPCSPRRHHEIFSGSVSHWKKGKLIGRGTFGHVYVGFNSESGEMCAIKEVTLFSDDDKSMESAKQLEQEILLLSTLRHKNIVQYYGSAMIEDKLHIYLEYVSGGSIHKLLQDYGHFGDLAIRNYTRQILSGLAYLHNKNTVHRDIKGANILVDPNGCVKLADFGMAKHITGHASLSFKGSPYWMAPEVVRNKSGCNLAVDIWSLGCTILEMATSKPPWSQYEGIAAMFKVGNSKDLPEIPDHLSDDGKDFVMLCLQREPSKRPTANELLQHPFVQSSAQIERSIVNHDLLKSVGDQIGIDTKGTVHAMHLSSVGVERMAIQDTIAEKSISTSSDCHLNNPSSPISPVGTTLAHSRSPQRNNRRRSPSPISSPLASGSTTPITVSQMRHIRSPQASGRRSPSPISSPMGTSGPSSPLTDGTGAIPLNQVNQSAYIHRGAGNTLLSSHDVLMNELYTLSNSRHNPSEKQATSPVSPYMLFSRPELMDPHKPLYGKLMFADQVSEQLVHDQRILHVTHGLIPGSLNHHGMDSV